MNSINLVGRLTRDPEIKEIGNNKNSVCNFTLAIRRNADDADFIDCTAWNKTAELICNYCKKGGYLAVNGALRNQSYTNNDGATVKKSYVLVNGITLLGSPQHETQQPQTDTIAFTDDDFPF